MTESAYAGLEGRLRWLEKAIKATAAWSKETGAEGRTDWMFAREPVDMDYSTDLVSAAKNAEETLKALEAERESILARKALFDRDADAGKYDHPSGGA